MLKHSLDNFGLLECTEFALNGEEAVIKFADLVCAGKHVSLVITDLMMPKLNGWSAVKRMKEFMENNAPANCPIKETEYVFVTAFKSQSFEKQAKEENYRVFDKPLTFEKLSEILHF